MKNLHLRLACLILTILYFITGIVAPVYAQVSYSYDQNGNVTSDGNNCFTYNEANQLVQVAKCSNNQIIAQYVYDYQGNRIEKKIYSNGTLQKTVYSPNDGYETVKLASNGATLNTTYYQVNDQQVAKKNPDGSKNYYLTDNLGSTNVLTNQTGAVIETTKYYPYGQVRAGGTSSKFLYTGQENDPETGLDYYNSRYYDAHLQRFIQPDSVLPNVYDPQQLNRYSYVRNNPIKYTDPSGHWDIPLIGNLIDLGLTVIDLVTVAIHPKDPTNWAALSADAAAMIVPGVPDGAGIGIRVVKAVGNVVKDTKTVEKGISTVKTVTNESKVVKEAADTSKGYKASNFRQNLGKITGNTPVGYDAHHVFPQKFRQDFKNAGLTIDDPIYGSWWESSSHRSAAYEYNKQWNKFLSDPSHGEAGPTLEDIVNFGRDISSDYDIKTNF